MTLSRRELSRIAFSGLASAGAGFSARKIPIAVQLYSVRHTAEKDLAGVLAHVGKAGFDGVEFAGYYGHDAPAIRKMLDGNGLKVAGTHIQLDTLLGDNLPRTLEFNRTIGNRILIVPGLPQKYRSSIAAWKETAKIFDAIVDRVQPEGYVLGYHNHTAEFQPMEGQTPFDVFFGSTKKDVKVQFDIGHAARAGADPEAVIQRYRGRVISVHIKEYQPGNEDVHLGEGQVKWKDVFRALESSGGVEWYIVEEEAKSCQAYDCIDRSLQRLRKMGK
jgi:sugar phosphate isomerase/epimerase